MEQWPSNALDPGYWTQGDQILRPLFRIRIHFGRLDPDPDPQLGIRTWIQEGQNEPQKWSKFKCWIARCSLLRDKDFSCSLDVLYGGLGIRKLQFLIKEISAVKPWIWIWIRIWKKKLDPDPYPDPHWNQCGSPALVPSNLCWSGTNPVVSLLPQGCGSASVLCVSGSSFFIF